MGAARSPLCASEPVAWLRAIGGELDCDSFASLFGFFAPKVKSYLLRRGVDPNIADEITQDTFLIIWRKAAQYDPGRATPAAWIYTIARNRWVDWTRQQTSRNDPGLAVTTEEQATPEQALTTAEQENLLRGALLNLPVEQAEVLRLCYFEDLSHSEISHHLGLPLGTVKSRIRLAAAHLRSCLGSNL